MLKSRLVKSASFFGAALAALMAVSAQPGRAVAFEGGDCGGYDGPLCSSTTVDVYCTDGETVWVCGSETTYTYYPKTEST